MTFLSTSSAHTDGVAAAEKRMKMVAVEARVNFILNLNSDDVF